MTARYGFRLVKYPAPKLTGLRHPKPIYGERACSQFTLSKIIASDYPVPDDVDDDARFRTAYPEQQLREMPIDDLLRLWNQKVNILMPGSRDEAVESLIHLCFPAYEERYLAYIMIWVIRDEVSATEVANRLSGKYTYNFRNVVNIINYGRRRLDRLANRLNLRDKIVDEFRVDFLEELLEGNLEVQIRETINEPGLY